uniref:Fibronectin type-III domain-containing protein n=2 Tax=Caenorhabditis japonica TaxID=281687 RepID=A0A8R1DSM0_CAEJA
MFSTGTNENGMKVHEASDDGSSTSQPTPPEFPSPPPPSNSPPESMDSLQADFPNGDATRRTNSVRPGGIRYPEEKPKVNVWMAHHGFHPVPGVIQLPPSPQSILFVHVNDGEHLNFQRPADSEVIGNLLGPGTVRMLGESGTTNHPLPIELRNDQQCHQFIDEEVPQLVGPQQLMNAMGIAPQQRPGSSRGNGSSNRGGRGGGHGRGAGNRNGQSNEQGRSQNNGGGGGGGGHGRGSGSGSQRGGHKFNNGRRDRHQVAHGPIPDMAQRMNMYPNADHMQPPPPPPPQHSLLGEPVVQPIPDMVIPVTSKTMVPPPPGFQPLAMTPQPEGQMVPPMNSHVMPNMSMAMVPVAMPDMPLAAVGQQMQPGLLQDPMVPGPSMGIPQIYGVPPPSGMMVMPGAGPVFNNNRWISYQTIEENESIREILFKALKQPSLANAFPTEVEILWKPIRIVDLKTQTSNGLFPMINDSDITYHASIFDTDGKFLMGMTLDPTKKGVGKGFNGQCLFSISNLRPNTWYQINVKAAVPDRGVSGDPCDMCRFITAPGRPDPPTASEITQRGTDFVVIVWNESNNNGIIVSLYNVYVFENEFADGRMIQVNVPKVRIAGLKPQTCYKVSINAINALGESMTPHRLNAFTTAVREPATPTNFRAVAQSHRSIRCSWDADPNSTFSLELFCPSSQLRYLVRRDFSGNNTIINELNPVTEYEVRLSAKNEFGRANMVSSIVKTQPFRRTENLPRSRNNSDEQRYQRNGNLDRPPSAPFFVRYVDGRPEMSWKSFGPGQNDTEYEIEGSSYNNPDSFRILHRGNVLSLVIFDEDIYYIRVRIVHRKGHRSWDTEPVIVPRDYNQYRPDRVNDVTMRLKSDGCVVAEWKKLDCENLKLPSTSTVLYHVQRSDMLDRSVKCVGNDTKCIFEGVPGETSISVCVRATVSYNDVFIPGDWSIPVSFTTPRSLPPAVINIAYDDKHSLLTWDCLDQSFDLQFTVEIHHLSDEAQVLKVTTKRKNVVVDGVQLGESYRVMLTSYTNVGRSPQHSALEFSVPAQKPGIPPNVTLICAQLDTCTFVWEASEPNGSSITGYLVKLLLSGQEIRSSFVEATDESTGYRLTQKDLMPSTVYQVSIVARNAVGDSDPVTIAAKTKALAPTVPIVTCTPDAHALKLSWEHEPMNKFPTYKVVRVNSVGQHMHVYEGETPGCKVRNLIEDTEYILKIKVTDRNTAAYSWSEPLVFRTKIAPPPAAKAPPKTSLVPGELYLYQITWNDLLKKQNKSTDYYHLQASDATIQNDKWATVYEGKETQYNLNTEKYPGAVHVRVVCVRKKDGKPEITGHASDPVYLANIPPEVDQNQVEENAGRINRIVRFIKANINPIIFVSVFFVLIVFLFNFSEGLFTWLSGASPSKVDSQNKDFRPPNYHPLNSPDLQ